MGVSLRPTAEVRYGLQIRHARTPIDLLVAIVSLASRQGCDNLLPLLVRRTMPQDRTVLHTGRDLRIERVRSHPASTEWSGVYATETQRFVLPMSDAGLDLRAHEETWLVDGLTAMRLSSKLAYQVRPGRQSVRESLVVSGRRLDACDAVPAFWLLCPRTLFRVPSQARLAFSTRV